MIPRKSLRPLDVEPQQRHRQVSRQPKPIGSRAGLVPGLIGEKLGHRRLRFCQLKHKELACKAMNQIRFAVPAQFPAEKQAARRARSGRLVEMVHELLLQRRQGNV